MGLARRDDQLHTYADYLRWPDDIRYELIDGVAYLMSPAPGVDHQLIATELVTQLTNALKGSPCVPLVAPVDVRLPKSSEAGADDDIDTVVQPDVLVVYDKSKLDRRGVRGAPDLVIEILSPSTAGHDHVLKRQAYERAGVREYWLVHPVDRLVTIYRLAGDEFGKPLVQELTGETAVAALDGLRIEWAPVTQRLDALDQLP